MESDELQQYYAELACDGGFEARCHMELPERSLVGARIVNVGCRRGKGTYKLSEQVGEGGFVVGVDWNEAFEEGWADFVYLNSSLSLFASPARALRECGRVLAPGGVLLAEVPVAEPNGKGRAGDADFAVDASRAAVVEAARALPNAVQAAPTFEELLAWLATAGFSEPVIRSERPLSPEEGSAPDRPVPTVPGDDATYRLLSLEGAR